VALAEVCALLRAILVRLFFFAVLLVQRPPSQSYDLVADALRVSGVTRHRRFFVASRLRLPRPVSTKTYAAGGQVRSIIDGVN